MKRSALPAHVRKLIEQQPGERPKAKRNKYNAKRVTVDGITFDSAKEGGYYSTLCQFRAAGDVAWFARQPIFDLPGGVKYKADFIVAWADGRTEVIDVKGMRTAIYKLKRKQVQALHGVEIIER